MADFRSKRIETKTLPKTPSLFFIVRCWRWSNGYGMQARLGRRELTIIPRRSDG